MGAMGVTGKAIALMRRSHKVHRASAMSQSQCGDG